jgi:hypothetical protein
MRYKPLAETGKLAAEGKEFTVKLMFRKYEISLMIKSKAQYI